MNVKEGVNKIKSLLENFKASNETVEATEETTTEETTTEETTENFEDAQLADGSVVSIEPAFEVGASVSVATEEGPQAIPDGDYELASGDVMSVAEGVITEIKPVEGEEEESEEAEEDMSTEAEAVNPKVVIERTEIEKKFAEINADNNANRIILDSLAKKNAQNNQVIEELFKVVTALAGEPTVEPTVSKTTLRKEAELKAHDKEIADAMAFVTQMRKRK